MNLKFLETFVWVARLRSFTLAANRMNATQAAISSRIAALETELGVKLFLRDHKKITLTPEGLNILARAEPLLKSARSLVDDLSGAGWLHGTVRIGVIDTISFTWLVDLIRSSKAQFPQINIEITADTTLRLVNLLAAGEIDVALIMGPVLEQGYLSVELCSYACHWVASPMLGLGGRASLDQIARFPIVSFPKGSQPHAAITRFFEQFPRDDHVIYTANSLATIIRMTADGIGVAAIPPVVAERELARGELELIDAQQPIPPMRLHAVYFDGPAQLIPATIAELARQVAHDFCQHSNPDWAWDRPSAGRSGSGPLA
ncbi:MAG: LysR family transcriptional regulator [Phaeovulum sp.]|uniref:LysR family transcriptional regulator n=1 Tax=Phaeovulum sp. TaxID=2934796 RepID=UPI0027356584|nr:LysR family transcriptional regulator [Phaeovulum sp.]MDP3862312.1 LysR family transcriptional regulator [Phaeovulum sp.]